MHTQLLCRGSSAVVAARRMRNILGCVLGRDGWMWRSHEVKLLNTSSGNNKHIWNSQEQENNHRMIRSFLKQKLQIVWGYGETIRCLFFVGDKIMFF